MESCARVSACCAARASPPAGGVTVVAVKSAPALPNGWAGGSRAVVFLSGPGVEALMSSFSELVSEVGFGSRLRSRLLLLFLTPLPDLPTAAFPRPRTAPQRLVASKGGGTRQTRSDAATHASHTNGSRLVLYRRCKSGSPHGTHASCSPLRARRRSDSPSAEQAIRRSRLLRAGSCKLVATCDHRGLAHLARRCVGQPLGPHKRRAHVRRESGGTDSRDERRRVWCRHAVAA